MAQLCDLPAIDNNSARFSHLDIEIGRTSEPNRPRRSRNPSVYVLRGSVPRSHVPLSRVEGEAAVGHSGRARVAPCAFQLDAFNWHTEGIMSDDHFIRSKRTSGALDVTGADPEPRIPLLREAEWLWSARTLQGGK